MTDDRPNILLIQADQLKPQVLSGYGGTAVTPDLERLCEEGAIAEENWDAAALEEEVRASQRERRLVQTAHGSGPAPAWDALESDPVWASCLRAPDDYNDWAWRGIKPLVR